MYADIRQVELIFIFLWKQLSKLVNTMTKILWFLPNAESFPGSKISMMLISKLCYLKKKLEGRRNKKKLTPRPIKKLTDPDSPWNWKIHLDGCIFCLFVCLRYYIPLEFFLLIPVNYNCGRVFNFDLCWVLNECSLACHAYCDTEHPFIMIISEDP